ncbi:GyrI-like domain-containing protein [Paenibacillus wynnii]|uniref:GyrI-like domain-containing protein n=1 Tax=Paenibacillus wynnii TaxID=268407 RepID=UPI002791A6B3|nr:effector binding domain-containing protein [Paenibacillus wynnii]MDQ0192461.1 putative transcriptional regulator YdeE [Paenibacillus wynnii]
MTKHIVKKQWMTLSGISTRTTNAKEMGSNGRLPQLWENYFQRSIGAQAEVVDPHLIYALYTDYESDATGAYTVLIGHELNNNGVQADTDLDRAVVPESTYMVFTTRKGPGFEVVAEAWGGIWEYFSHSQEEERSYTGDFEIYDSQNLDPSNTVVKIYIAIK